LKCNSHHVVAATTNWFIRDHLFATKSTRKTGTQNPDKSTLKEEKEHFHTIDTFLQIPLSTEHTTPKMGSVAVDSPTAPQPEGKAAAAAAAAVPEAVKRAVEAKVYGYMYSFIEMGAVKLFIEHKVFAALPADGSPISLADLAAETGSGYNMLERLANFLVACDVLSAGDKGPRTYAHGKTSRFFLDEGVSLMFSHLFDNCLLPVAHWPEYFGTHGLTEPTKANVTPWGLSWGHPDKTNYEVFELFPDKALPFNASMKVGVADMPITGMYDFSWLARYAAADKSGRTLLVDVGGGMGQALKAILAENPDIPAGRCALQDRPETIEEVEKEADEALAEVQKFGASFHGEEPVKGKLKCSTPILKSSRPSPGPHTHTHTHTDIY
jgi:hypothetical protein